MTARAWSVTYLSCLGRWLTLPDCPSWRVLGTRPAARGTDSAVGPECPRNAGPTALGGTVASGDLEPADWWCDADGSVRVTAPVKEVIDMVRIEGQIVIGRPVEEVFDFVADESNEPRYNPRMGRSDKITNGPIGVGTRFRAETTSMRRPVPMVIEFTGYDRPRRLASTTHLSSMDLQGTLTFDPIPEGTRMQWSWDVEPQGVLKVMTPLVALMGRRQEQRIWTGLKHLLEGQTGRGNAAREQGPR